MLWSARTSIHTPNEVISAFKQSVGFAGLHFSCGKLEHHAPRLLLETLGTSTVHTAEEKNPWAVVLFLLSVLQCERKLKNMKIKIKKSLKRQELG